VTAWPRPRWAVIAVLATFAALEVGFAIWAAFFAEGRFGPRVGYGPDSILYLTAAHEPVWSRRFLAGPGGFGFLLLAKLCLRNLRAIVIVQTLVAVGAWSFLAAVVSGVMRSNVARWVAFAGILGLGLVPGVLQWNAMIVTESLSISALCATIGCGIRLVQRGTWRELGWFLGAMTVFAFTRDTNALLVGVIGVLALGFTFRSELRARAATIAFGGIVLALGASALSNAAEPPRWYWPVAETTAVRLLADPEATRYLVDHGFPWDAQMASLPRRYIYLYDPVRTGASFAAFRAWVERDGRRVYLGFLASHPGWALREPFNERDALLDVGAVEVYGQVYGNRPGGPFTAIGAVAAPGSPAVVGTWAAASAAALVVLVARRRVRGALAAAVGAVGGLAVAGYYAAWYGDALELNRHSLSAAVQLLVACWIVTALVVDALATRGRRSEVRVPQDADLDEQEHQGTPADEPVRAGADSGAHGLERAH
jgi:hypothetical protein